MRPGRPLIHGPKTVDAGPHPRFAVGAVIVVDDQQQAAVGLLDHRRPRGQRRQARDRHRSARRPRAAAVGGSHGPETLKNPGGTHFRSGRRIARRSLRQVNLPRDRRDAPGVKRGEQTAILQRGDRGVLRSGRAVGAIVDHALFPKGPAAVPGAQQDAARRGVHVTVGARPRVRLAQSQQDFAAGQQAERRSQVVLRVVTVEHDVLHRHRSRAGRCGGKHQRERQQPAPASGVERPVPRPLANVRVMMPRPNDSIPQPGDRLLHLGQRHGREIHAGGEETNGDQNERDTRNLIRRSGPAKSRFRLTPRERYHLSPTFETLRLRRYLPQ
jgi:hypothetical protein